MQIEHHMQTLSFHSHPSSSLSHRSSHADWIKHRLLAIALMILITSNARVIEIYFFNFIAIKVSDRMRYQPTHPLSQSSSWYLADDEVSTCNRFSDASKLLHWLQNSAWVHLVYANMKLDWSSAKSDDLAKFAQAVWLLQKVEFVLFYTLDTMRLQGSKWNAYLIYLFSSISTTFLPFHS